MIAEQYIFSILFVLVASILKLCTCGGSADFSCENVLVSKFFPRREVVFKTELVIAGIIYIQVCVFVKVFVRDLSILANSG